MSESKGIFFGADDPFHRIISPNIRLRYPDLFTVGEDSIIDDFCYFTGIVTIGKGCHIASSTTIGGGGRTRRFTLGDYSGMGPGCRVFMGSSDYVRGLITAVAPEEGDIKGDVIFGNYTGIGANSVVMPDNDIPEGVAIGALSFVPSRFVFEPWSVYMGTPIRKVMPRNKGSVMKQLEEVLARTQ